MFNRAGQQTPAAGLSRVALVRARVGGADAPAPIGAPDASPDALFAAWQHSGEPTLIVGRDGHIVCANSALERYAGAIPGGLRGLPISALVDADTAATCARALRPTVAAGRIEGRGQLRARRGLKACRVRIVPVNAERARPMQLVVAFPPDAGVGETSALGRALGSVARLVGEFAHDLNNELAVLINCTSMLRRKLGDRPELSVHLQELHSAAWRSARLARQAGQLAPRYSTGDSVVRLDQVVADMVPILELVLAGTRLLEVEVSPHLPPVALPRGRVEQVLLEVARMARELGPDQGPLRVQVTARDGQSPLELRMGPVPTGTETGNAGDPSARAVATPLAKHSPAGAQVSLDEESLTADTSVLVMRIPRRLTR